MNLLEQKTFEELVNKYNVLVEDNQKLFAQNKEFWDWAGEMQKEDQYICKITGGPVQFEDMGYYSVSFNQQEKLVAFKNLLKFEAGIPKVGDRVVVLKSAIIAIVPEGLSPASSELQDTKLTTWAEIGGMESKIKAVRDAVEIPLQHADLAKEFGLKPIKGILLYGPPGNGKTMIAKALASAILKMENASPEAFRYIKGPEIHSKYIGEAEAAVRDLFEETRRYAQKTGQRAVVFIDEADALLPPRGSRKSSDIEATIVPQFLAEMDGFAEHNPLILLASNLPNSIDEAILREGRIDIKVEIGRPTRAEAQEILAIHFKDALTYEDKAVLAEYGANVMFREKLAFRASGAMCATLVNLAKQAALSRFLADPEDRKGIKRPDLETAYEQLVIKDSPPLPEITVEEPKTLIEKP